LELAKFNFTSWYTGTYKIQFYKLAYWNLQNSISQAGKQKLTTIPPADIDSHKSAGTRTDPPCGTHTFKGHRNRTAVTKED
jgi:hypothetical protein